MVPNNWLFHLFVFLVSGSVALVQKKEAAHQSQKQAEETKQQEDTVVSHQEATWTHLRSSGKITPIQ